MDQFYQSLCAAFAWPEDAALTAAMRAHNEAAVVAADAKVADAEKNQGEMEGMGWRGVCAFGCRVCRFFPTVALWRMKTAAPTSVRSASRPLCSPYS
jgi:hypothetical protein